MLIGGLAAGLAIAFTTGLAGGRDPNYVLQPHLDELHLDVGRDVDCTVLGSLRDWEGGASSDDWQLRRDAWRVARLLDCDD